MSQSKQIIRNQTQAFEIIVYWSLTYSVWVMYLNILKTRLIIFTFINVILFQYFSTDEWYLHASDSASQKP